MIKVNRISLGSFINKSGVFAINDVCDDVNGTLGIKKGKWNAYVDEYDNRNLKLIVMHEKCKFNKNFKWIDEDVDINIFTGEVGVFDWDNYQGGKDFYEHHSITEGDMVGANFVKCMSGLGDGIYNIYWHVNRGDNVDAVMIKFLDEDWFED